MRSRRFIVFHDAGAYGAGMSSNYNSRPLIPEVLVDGEELSLIRRRQTIQDLCMTHVYQQGNSSDFHLFPSRTTYL
jgi:hypothetical protein